MRAVEVRSHGPFLSALARPCEDEDFVSPFRLVDPFRDGVDRTLIKPRGPAAGSGSADDSGQGNELRIAGKPFGTPSWTVQSKSTLMLSRRRRSGTFLKPIVGRPSAQVLAAAVPVLGDCMDFVGRGADQYGRSLLFGETDVGVHVRSHPVPPRPVFLSLGIDGIGSVGVCCAAVLPGGAAALTPSVAGHGFSLLVPGSDREFGRSGEAGGLKRRALLCLALERTGKCGVRFALADTETGRVALITIDSTSSPELDARLTRVVDDLRDRGAIRINAVRAALATDRHNASRTFSAPMASSPPGLASRTMRLTRLAE